MAPKRNSYKGGRGGSAKHRRGSVDELQNDQQGVEGGLLPAASCFEIISVIQDAFPGTT